MLWEDVKQHFATRPASSSSPWSPQSTPSADGNAPNLRGTGVDVAALADVEKPPESATADVEAPATTTRVRFDSKRAKALLAAEKVGGLWRENAPTEAQSAEFLRKHFTGIPSDSHRKVLRAVWPGVRPGPRPKPKTAE